MSTPTHHPLALAANATSEGAALGHPETHPEASLAPQAALEDPKPLQAVLVPENQRMGFLPKLFGDRWFGLGERKVYDWMSELCDQYASGYWDFYSLGTQGAGFMAPSTDKPLALFVDGNGFHGAMSPQAAGIVVTLFTLSHLSFRAEGAPQELLVDHYHALREFASDHAEAGLIFAAID